jgi:hypothetical protein
VNTVRTIFCVVLLSISSGVGAQSPYCQLMPEWKVLSVTETSNQGDLLLSVQTTDDQGVPHTLAVPVRASRPSYLMTDGYFGWTIRFSVEADFDFRSVKVWTEAWCDRRLKYFDETVLPLLWAPDSA